MAVFRLQFRTCAIICWRPFEGTNKEWVVRAVAGAVLVSLSQPVTSGGDYGLQMLQVEMID